MSVRLTSLALNAPLATSDKSALVVMAFRADDSGAVWLSVSTIGFYIGASKRTALRAVNSLEKSGYISAERRPGLPTLYRIDAQKLEETAVDPRQIDTTPPDDQCQSVTGAVTPCHHLENEPVTDCHGGGDKLAGEGCQIGIGVVTPCHPIDNDKQLQTLTDNGARGLIEILRRIPAVDRCFVIREPDQADETALAEALGDSRIPPPRWAEFCRAAADWCSTWKQMGANSTKTVSPGEIVRKFASERGDDFRSEGADVSARIDFPGPPGLAAYFERGGAGELPWKPIWARVNADGVRSEVMAFHSQQLDRLTGRAV